MRDFRGEVGDSGGDDKIKEDCEGIRYVGIY